MTGQPVTNILVGMKSRGAAAGQAGYDPEATRTMLLDAAFEEIYARGFRATGLAAILEKTGLTKGALYHHFGNKLKLGYAVVDERVKTLIRERYLEPFKSVDDPIQGLKQMGQRMEQELLKVGILEKGCPVNNLVQEMSGVDEGFRRRLAELLGEWNETIASGLRHGQATGTVRSDVEVSAVATLIVASYLGACGFAKNAMDIAPFTACRSNLNTYVDSLRPLAPARLEPVAR